MKFHKKMSILDFKVDDDLLIYDQPIYPINLKKSEVLGFSVGRIKSINDSIDAIQKSVNNQLIDSISIEIQVTREKKNPLLSLMIQADDINLLKIKHKNLKTALNHSDSIDFYQKEELETFFFSILIDPTISIPEEVSINKDKNGFFLSGNKIPKNTPQYLLLKSFNPDIFLNELDSMNLVLKILEIIDVEGSIVLNLQYDGLKYYNSIWIMLRDDNLVSLGKKISSNLDFLGLNLNYQIKLKEIPYIFLRIINSKTPIANPDLNLANWKKMYNQLNFKYDLAEDSNQIHIDKNKNPHNSIEKILITIDNSYKRTKHNIYELFNESYLLFMCESLNFDEINELIHYIGIEYKQIFIYFIHKEDYYLLVSKLRGLTLKRMHLIDNFTDLIGKLTSLEKPNPLNQKRPRMDLLKSTL